MSLNRLLSHNKICFKTLTTLTLDDELRTGNFNVNGHTVIIKFKADQKIYYYSNHLKSNFEFPLSRSDSFFSLGFPWYKCHDCKPWTNYPTQNGLLWSNLFTYWHNYVSHTITTMRSDYSHHTLHIRSGNAADRPRAPPNA